MKNILASVVIAAFTAATVVPISAATSSTSPTTQKKHTAMSMQQCVKKRMGSMKGTAAMKKAQSWCTAHKVTKKKTTTSTY